MGHVSRIHRVALGWSFGGIKSHMFTPKNHLADMLTKGSLTRDEWDHLLRLLHIMNFSMFSCSHSLSYRKQSVMSKRAQECTAKEVSAVAKPTPMILVSRNLLSAKKNPFARFECFEQPRESRVGSELCFSERQETGAKQEPRPNSTFSTAATG